MPVDGGELVLTLPSPKDAAEREDLETFEVILAQYAVLQRENTTTPLGVPLGSPGVPSPSTTGSRIDAEADLKGRLVLVDEDNGQVVGLLDEHFNIREDEGMHVEGNEKYPVVVEIPADDDDDDGPSVGRSGSGTPKVKREIFVHTIPVDDSDWISQTAGFLGYVLLLHNSPSFNHPPY